jgi:uncharacterized membrane protein
MAEYVLPFVQFTYFYYIHIRIYPRIELIEISSQWIKSFLIGYALPLTSQWHENHQKCKVCALCSRTAGVKITQKFN